MSTTLTCIVGLIYEGDVLIGGDSACVGGYDITIRKDPKVFRNGPFVMGFTTSFRMGQLLRYRFSPPTHHDDFEDHCFMATAFIDEVRRCLKEGGYSKKEDEQEEGGTFLVGYRGRLYKIEDDYQVGESIEQFMSVGCGSSYALGSLYSTSGMYPDMRVTTALECAEKFSAGVRGPFVIERLSA